MPLNAIIFISTFHPIPITLLTATLGAKGHQGNNCRNIIWLKPQKGMCIRIHRCNHNIQIKRYPSSILEWSLELTNGKTSNEMGQLVSIHKKPSVRKLIENLSRIYFILMKIEHVQKKTSCKIDKVATCLWVEYELSSLHGLHSCVQIIYISNNCNFIFTKECHSHQSNDKLYDWHLL